MIQQYYKQPDGFYFLFVENGKLICEENSDVDLQLLDNMNDSPSPYYLIRNRNNYIFIDSDATIYQMENR